METEFISTEIFTFERSGWYHLQQAPLPLIEARVESGVSHWVGRPKSMLKRIGITANGFD
jgi:hypothetical protein